MTRVEEIQSAIEALSAEEYAILREWLTETDWARWDQQIEEDSHSGRLEWLTREAMASRTRGELEDL